MQIPATLMAAANLILGDTVNVREGNGGIVIEPMRENLAALIAGITSENLHGEASFYPAIGKEML